MTDLVQAAANILSRSTQRIEISGQNISNVSTPGYKRRVGFEQILSNIGTGSGGLIEVSSTTDFADGKIVDTGNPYDLAISDDGFFAVRSNNGVQYTRQGQFTRVTDGRLVTAGGLTLQAEGGGDLIVGPGAFEVSADGTVLEDGTPVGRVAVVAIDDLGQAERLDAGAFNSAKEGVRPLGRPQVRQGVLEASNVTSGDEMVAMMEALRRAETAQRLINTYDDLMGRALQTFEQT